MTAERGASPKGGKGPARGRPRGLDNWRGVGSYGTLGLDIALSIALGFFVGRFLDGKLGTAPWISIFGFICGLGAAIKAVMRAMRQMAAETAREEREQGNPKPIYGKPDDRDDRAESDEPRKSPPPEDKSKPEEGEG